MQTLPPHGLTYRPNEAALTGIESPTLVLWGDSDRTYNWEQQNKLWTEIANTQLAVMPGCAHAAHLEKPELFNRLLGSFLLANRS